MNKSEIKTLWKLAKNFWIGGFVLWIIETAIFLIYEGWHLKATHPIEIYCDDIVSGMWHFALSVTIVTCVYSLININKKPHH